MLQRQLAWASGLLGTVHFYRGAAEARETLEESRRLFGGGP